MLVRPLQMICNKRRVPLLNQRTFSSAETSWQGIPLEEGIEPVSIYNIEFTEPTIVLGLKGKGLCRWRHRGTIRIDTLEANSTFIACRGTKIESSIMHSSRVLAVLQPTRAFIQAYFQDERTPLADERNLAHLQIDRRAGDLVALIRAEIHAGCASGRLFAELISASLISYVSSQYFRYMSDAEVSCVLSPFQRRRLYDFIRDHLKEDLSVSDLAAITQMSPSYFRHSFKCTFGETPYRYILKEKISIAKEMLTQTSHDVGYIGAEMGFSSQSHFSKVFRQFAGVSPMQFRKHRS